MTTVSISELKARLSAFLDIVREGDEVPVTDRGRLRGPTTTLPSDFFARARPSDASGHSLAALLGERADER